MASIFTPLTWFFGTKEERIARQENKAVEQKQEKQLRYNDNRERVMHRKDIKAFCTKSKVELARIEAQIKTIKNPKHLHERIDTLLRSITEKSDEATKFSLRQTPLEELKWEVERMRERIIDEETKRKNKQ